jgi:hypothetical protein
VIKGIVLKKQIKTKQNKKQTNNIKKQTKTSKQKN